MFPFPSHFYLSWHVNFIYHQLCIRNSLFVWNPSIETGVLFWCQKSSKNIHIKGIVKSNSTQYKTRESTGGWNDWMVLYERRSLDLLSNNLLWEKVLPQALHLIRSFSCPAINTAAHKGSFSKYGPVLKRSGSNRIKSLIRTYPSAR